MMKRLAEIEARKLEIRKLLEGESEVDLTKIEEELRALEEEAKELRRRQEMAQNIHDGTSQARTVAATPVETPEQRVVDKFDTTEYRKAFMDYVTRGVKGDHLEFRADATTGTGDIGAIIPTTILNRIVEKMEDVGRIWSRVTKTGVQAGVQIPISTAKPTATWVAAGTMSDKQKKTVSGYISFSYYKLQCRVAVELVAGTVALPLFEATIANNIAEAMVKAIEEAIISGSGAGQPLGIVNHTNIPAAQVVEVAAADFSKWKTWTGLLGKVPRAYRSGVALIMNDADWNTHIVGMVDANGQPVARVTFGLDGTMQERFLGREVIPVEELLPSIDTAVAGDVVAILVRLEDYMVNSNMAITYRRYFDENTDEWVSKATMIADGKLADPNGVVLIKLKAA
ncbi:MAG: phage major capsid protein [Bacillota bacterium]